MKSLSLLLPIFLGLASNSQAHEHMESTVVGTLIKRTESIKYCFPDTSNNSAVGGRIFLQPLAIDCHLAHVIPGFSAFAQYQQSADGNGLAGSGSHGFEKTTLSTDTIRFGFSLGKEISGRKFEIGVIGSRYLDSRQNLMMEVANGFHRAIDEHGFIPKNDALLGGYAGKINVAEEVKQALAGFIKVQVFEQNIDDGLLSRPDLAISLSTRIPTSLDNPFDQPSIGLSVAAQKQIFSWLTAMAAAAVSCNAYKSKIFKDDDVYTRLCVGDLFAGTVIDPGEKGGVYVVGGFNLQQNRIGSRRDPLQTEFSPVASLAVRYLNQVLDCGVSVTEGLEARPVSRKEDITVGVDCKLFNIDTLPARLKSFLGAF